MLPAVVVYEIPAKADAVGVVDRQGRAPASARGFLELVGPAAVIGHRPPAELAERILALRRDEIGVVDQEDRDLALEVLALEIVPAAFGGADAVTDAYHRRVRDDRAVLGLERRDIDVGAEAQRRRGALETGSASCRERVCQYV